MIVSKWSNREFKSFIYLPCDFDKRIETDDGLRKNELIAIFGEDFPCMWLPENNEEVFVDTKEENTI